MASEIVKGAGCTHDRLADLANHGRGHYKVVNKRELNFFSSGHLHRQCYVPQTQPVSALLMRLSLKQQPVSRLTLCLKSALATMAAAVAVYPAVAVFAILTDAKVLVFFAAPAV